MEIQGYIDSHVVKMSDNFKSAMDIKISKPVYACNLPFNITDHHQLVNVVKMLIPGYIPPNHKPVSYLT